MGKKEERMQKILDHSLNLFVKKGFHQTLTSEITESVGIGKGTLFNYFEKKEDILNTLYLQVKNEFFSVLSNEKSPDEHIYKRLKKGWMNFVSWGIKNYNKVLFLMQMEDSPLISEEIKNYTQSKKMKYRLTYEEGIDQGLLKDIPIIMATSWYYQGMLTTIKYIVKFHSSSPEAEQKKISEEMFNNYLYGVRV